MADSIKLLYRIANLFAVISVLLFFLGELFIFLYISTCLVATRSLGWPLPLTIVLAAVVLPFWSLAVWAYLQTAFSDPGYVPRSYTPDTSNILITDVKRDFAPNTLTLCSKCERLRPERAHHCSFCGRCIRRMDHHCPWVANCIGLQNLRYFIQFCAYTFIVSTYFTIFMLASFIHYAATIQDETQRVKPHLYGILIIGIMSCGLFSIASLTILFLEVKAACCNVTFIEMNYETPNPYDIGRQANLKQMLGAYGLAWFLPIQQRHTNTDGYNYPTSLGYTMMPRMDDARNGNATFSTVSSLARFAPAEVKGKAGDVSNEMYLPAEVKGKKTSEVSNEMYLP